MAVCWEVSCQELLHLRKLKQRKSRTKKTDLKMLSEEKRKRVKDDFARFIRIEAMTVGCFQDDILEVIETKNDLL